MKIIFYCQYVLGMGHFFRSLQIASALSDHEVILVVGGQAVDADLPEHVRLVRLPALYMDEHFTTLIAEQKDQDVEAVKEQRKAILSDLFREIRPDLFMIELYPFGRTIFQFELDPLLEKIGAGEYGRVLRVCSLRDVLVEKRDPVEYEARVLGKLNRLFDLLLIHSDADFLPLTETFGRVGDITIPLCYTGFVTRHPSPGSARAIRKELGIGPETRLIVASAGGGRTGYRLLKNAALACRTLLDSHDLRVEIFSGPFMDETSFRDLSAQWAPGISVRRFTKRLPAYLSAADLSISMAGYNTCMDLLVRRAPALVYPYARQQEQPIRAQKIKHLLPMRVLSDEDLDTDTLAAHIREMLFRPWPAQSLPLNLDGAGHTARILEQRPVLNVKYRELPP